MCIETGADRETLSRKPDSWLDIQLYCTGAEPVKGYSAFCGESKEGMLSLQQDSKVNGDKHPAGTFPAVQRPEYKLFSSFFLKPRQAAHSHLEPMA